jgi:ring-1,2-phenylacetyl-CoA epoxidase subunit PaaB
MALLMARDVFVRRPPCASLWVAPAEHILSRTAHELEHAAWPEEESDPQAQAEFYYVFQKQKEAGSPTFVGAVEAVSPGQALRRALAVFAQSKALVWWVFPVGSVTSSAAGDVESMFEPAVDKPFRDQADYHTVARMKGIKKGFGGTRGNS